MFGFSLLNLTAGAKMLSCTESNSLNPYVCHDTTNVTPSSPSETVLLSCILHPCEAGSKIHVVVADQLHKERERETGKEIAGMFLV